jgi:hypothetical protein
LGADYDVSPRGLRQRNVNEERRDDWRTDIEARTVNNTAAIGQLQDTFEEIKQSLSVMDKLVRGDPDADRAGLLERLHDAERKLQKCDTVLFVGDYTGRKGLVERFNRYEDKDHRAQDTKKLHWTFYGTLVIAVFGIISELIHAWPEIASYWNQKTGDVVEQKIENVKHPRARHKRIVVHIPQDEGESDGQLYDSQSESEK